MMINASVAAIRHVIASSIFSSSSSLSNQRIAASTIVVSRLRGRSLFAFRAFTRSLLPVQFLDGESPQIVARGEKPFDNERAWLVRHPAPLHHRVADSDEFGDARPE
jgi:hypothetical protein